MEFGVWSLDGESVSSRKKGKKGRRNERRNETSLEETVSLLIEQVSTYCVW